MVHEFHRSILWRFTYLFENAQVSQCQKVRIIIFLFCGADASCISFMGAICFFYVLSKHDPRWVSSSHPHPLWCPGILEGWWSASVWYLGLNLDSKNPRWLHSTTVFGLPNFFLVLRERGFKTLNKFGWASPRLGGGLPRTWGPWGGQILDPKPAEES